MRTDFVILATLLLAGCASAPDPADFVKEGDAVSHMKTPSGEPLPDFDTWWDYGDPAATEERFRDLLPLAECEAPDDYTAQLLTQIARTEGLQRRFDDAHATLDRAESLLPYSTDVAKARYLLERGRALNSAGKPAEAEPVFADALRVAQEDGEDYYAVDAAHMLAIVTKGDASLAWNAKAIELAEASEAERARKWLGTLYNNTGWTYHDMARYDDALALFEKRLAMFPEGDISMGQRIARWCRARCLRSLDRVEEAMAEQRALEAIEQAQGPGKGYVQEELGECLLALGRADEAKPYFADAYVRLSAKEKWLLEVEPERMARLKELGGL